MSQPSRRWPASPGGAAPSGLRGRPGGRGEVRGARGGGLRPRVACLRGADPLVGALGKHLALIGFMGAGKSTVGRDLAERTARPLLGTPPGDARPAPPV